MPHVTFIHGIANKPEEKKLVKIWLDALAGDLLGNDDGLDLGASGVTTSMIYWADVLYDKPLEEVVAESVINFENAEGIALSANVDADMSWREGLTGEEKAMVDALAAKLAVDTLVSDVALPTQAEMAITLERIPLPWFVKRKLMAWLLKDVHHYLFNTNYSPRPGVSYNVQDEIRRRTLEKLNAVNTDKHIVVSHSMGTVIMYDCLKRVTGCPPINGLMTIGSPLGIDEVQDKLAPEWSREDGYPAKVNGPWINVYDMLDPVTGFDGNIANDFKQNGNEVIQVIKEENWGAWRHNITQYFSEPKLRQALKSMLDL
ncbi:hypothetical protein ACFGVR_02760 [Mucilaginibacter sp. AW1-3]